MANDDTTLVFTSDHGDYLGDHWLGEKDLFHQPSVKLPLIFVDPRPGANVTRGQQCDALVGAIDVLPTLVELCNLDLPTLNPLDGTSLVPLLRGDTQALRDRRGTAAPSLCAAATRC